MSNTTMADIGVQDPEQNNSPIIGKMDEDFDAINQGSKGQVNGFSKIERLPTAIT